LPAKDRRLIAGQLAKDTAGAIVHEDLDGRRICRRDSGSRDSYCVHGPPKKRKKMTFLTVSRSYTNVVKSASCLAGATLKANKVTYF